MPSGGPRCRRPWCCPGTCSLPGRTSGLPAKLAGGWGSSATRFWCRAIRATRGFAWMESNWQPTCPWSESTPAGVAGPATPHGRGAVGARAHGQHLQPARGRRLLDAGRRAGHQAFRIEQEAEPMRERYGRTKFGQSSYWLAVGRGGRVAGDRELGRRNPQRQGLAVLGHAQPQFRGAQRSAGPALRSEFFGAAGGPGPARPVGVNAGGGDRRVWPHAQDWPRSCRTG